MTDSAGTHFASEDDFNRMIIVVTGANSGLGLGYCHRILRQLSLPPSTPTPDAFNLRPFSPFSRPSTSASSWNRPPPTLTLILACRNKQKALAAIQILRKEHELGLMGRRLKGLPEREGWLAGLRIVFEPLDVDSPQSPISGILPLCERLTRTYPHITTLVLNAGIMALTGISYPRAFAQTMRDPVGAVTDPKFMLVELGRKSGDGKRGGIWGVNTLANYVLARQLRPLLARSPLHLPLAPRILFVTSKQADPKQVPSMFPSSSHDVRSRSGADRQEGLEVEAHMGELDLDKVDHQLMRTEQSYDASKYISELIFARLDASEEFSRQPSGPPRRVRCLSVDPGVVHTSFATGVLPWWMVGLMVVVFWVARLAGSQEHNISAANGAGGLSWATLVDDEALDEAVSPSSRAEGPSSKNANGDDREGDPLLPKKPRSNPDHLGPTRYCSRITRLGRSYTAKEPTKAWSAYGGAFASRAMEECERARGEWVAEAGAEAGHGKDGDGTTAAGEGEEYKGVKEGAEGTVMV